MNFRIFNHFDYGDVRVTNESSGIPLFVAKDVASALGYCNVSNCISKYCKRVVLTNELEKGAKAVRLIPESDVYRLILCSRSRRAIHFQDWICDYVIPKIRGNHFNGQVKSNKTEIRNSYTIRNSKNGKSYGITNEQRIVELEKKMEIVLGKIGIFNNDDKNYSTLSEYIQEHCLSILVNDYAQLGRHISDVCKKRNIKVIKMTDKKRSLNLYPNYILCEVLSKSVL